MRRDDYQKELLIIIFLTEWSRLQSTENSLSGRWSFSWTSSTPWKIRRAMQEIEGNSSSRTCGSYGRVMRNLASTSRSAGPASRVSDRSIDRLQIKLVLLHGSCARANRKAPSSNRRRSIPVQSLLGVHNKAANCIPVFLILLFQIRPVIA